MHTSGYAEDEFGGLPDGAPGRRIAAVELVEEVVYVGEGGYGLHPPFERAQDQELHPLDRPRLEHVPSVPDLVDPAAVVITRSQTKCCTTCNDRSVISAGLRCAIDP
jgi:hypothetical protein